MPVGRWGIAVSGGADSVALLRLCARDGCVVIHVNHQTRGEASDDDARFVQTLSGHLNLPCHFEVAPAEGEAGWRHRRLDVYRRALDAHALDGVLLAHHADDLAETLGLRLIRGNPRSGTLGLAPLQHDSMVRGVRLVRPLLSVRRDRLRRFLKWIGQPWREDATNADAMTPRNALRQALAGREDRVQALLKLADATAAAEAALQDATPRWPVTLDARQVLPPPPPPIARRAARRWLVERGVPEADASPAAVDRLLALLDPAGPRACDFPGGVHVVRRRGIVRHE